MRLLINDVEVDVIERDIVARYAISKLFDFTAPATTRTEEIELPKTAKNLSAIGYADVLLNDGTTVFNLLDAQLYVDGVDMQIEKAQVVGVKDTIKVRLFGQNVSFFAAIADKYIDELDLSALDHTWDFTTVTANLQNTSGYLYPIIDYSDILDTGSDVNAEALYPAIFAGDILQQIATDAGYTIAGDLTTDATFEKELVPFANKEPIYITDDEIAELEFRADLMYLGVGSVLQTIPATTEARVEYNVQVTGENWDTALYEFVAPRYGRYNFFISIYAQAAAGSSACIVSLYKQSGALPEENVFSRPYTWTTTVSLYARTTSTTTMTHVELLAGDKVYVKVLAGANDLQIQKVQTYIELYDMNPVLTFGGDWRVALNLPKIKQADFVRQYVRDYGCLVSINERTKVITLQKITTTKAADQVDWSDKLDWKTPEISFESQLAQVNVCKYLDDENVVKDRGRGVYRIANTALPGTMDLITSIYGACNVPGIYLDENIPIYRIESAGSNTAKPRRLLSSPTDVYSVNIFSDSEGLDASFTDLDIASFGALGYDTIISTILADMLSTLTNMRTVTLPLRLTPADINQLDFLRPVYIERYGVNFLIMDIEYNYTRRTASAKLLVI